MYCHVLQSTAMHDTALQYTTMHSNALQCTTMHYTALQYTTIHSNALQCTAMHCTTPLHLQLGGTDSWSLHMDREIRGGRNKGGRGGGGGTVLVVWSQIIPLDIRNEIKIKYGQYCAIWMWALTKMYLYATAVNYISATLKLLPFRFDIFKLS